MLHCNGIDPFVTLMGNFNWGPISRNDIVSTPWRVTNQGRFGPVPVRSGRFGPGRFGPISEVSRFGPVGAGRFGPIS